MTHTSDSRKIYAPDCERGRLGGLLSFSHIRRDILPHTHLYTHKRAPFLLFSPPPPSPSFHFTRKQQGVLNILMGEHGIWVLNKQTPNRQIWWSSPLSGPLRFEYDPTLQQWVTTRGRKELFALLAEEVQKVSGVDIQARRTKH